MEDINSCIAGTPPQLFSITHNDAGIQFQNRWIEKLGKKGRKQRENYQIGGFQNHDLSIWKNVRLR